MLPPLASGVSCQRKLVSSHTASWIPAFAGMTKTQGFSLVELSIVLVILGLLAGGVLTGQSLIRAAELRSVTTAFQNYHAAINTFRDKYMSFPGDMPNAVRFWGAQAGATTDGYDATCAALTTAATTTATCNGNGDGRASPNFTAQYYERFRFWQHLANAGLIEGNYTGISGSATTYDSDIGINVPAAKISQAGWTPIYNGTMPSGHAIYLEGDYGNTLIFGEAGNGLTNLPAIKPEEAYNIDMKIDDGKAGYGVIVGMTDSFNSDCLGTDSPSTAAWELTQTSKTCALVIKIK